MKQLRYIFLLLALLMVSPLVNAQIGRLSQRSGGGEDEGEQQRGPTDKEKSDASPDTAKVLVYKPEIHAAYTLQPVTAPLHNFQDYSKNLTSFQTCLSLGNPGSAFLPLTFEHPSFQGFQLTGNAFSRNMYSFDSIKFYIPESPFSEINYMMGKVKEQRLLFTLSQRIRKGLIIGLHARYANAPGIYQRQRGYYASGYFTVSYTLPSNRYGVMAAYLNDRCSINENGGLTYDSVFSDNTETNRKTIPINLTNAVNRNRQTGVLLQQHFNLQRSLTAIADSGRTRKFKAGRIVHTFQYSRKTSGYQDDNSITGINAGIYPAVYGDSTLTYDSTFVYSIQNSLVYSNIEPDTSDTKFPFQYSIGIRHEITRLGYGNIANQVNPILPAFRFSKTEYTAYTDLSKSYKEVWPFATLKGIIAGKTFFIADGKLCLGGYHAGDHSLQGTFFQQFGRKNLNGKVFLTAEKVSGQPDYFYTTQYSNHFRWNNNLSRQNLISGTLGLEMKGFNLRLQYSLLDQYAWLGSDLMPHQYDKTLSITRIDAYKLFQPGHWVFDIRVTGQQVNNDSILELPKVVAKGSISYQMQLFNKVLKAQVGISCWYYTSYHADAYMPELSAFYRQNEILTGNYPYLDAFVNMRIKRARIFLMYEHFNASFMGYTYYMIPHYPGADAAFKAGVSWMFYD